jgi:hypothetical protein
VSDRISKYLLYTGGEILLVVIGILIALQVNNWNENRLEQRKIYGYFKEIKEELIDNINLSKNYIRTDSSLVYMIERSLIIINEANPDSLNLLDKTLGAVGTSFTRTYTLPVTEDFISSGIINHVNEDSIKFALRRLKLALETTQNLNQYISDQYQLKIEPFFNHNINYSRVILDDDKENVLVGGPDSDYNSLLGNMEAWNIINFKLEVTNASLSKQRRTLRIMEFLVDKLNDVLIN